MPTTPAILETPVRADTAAPSAWRRLRRNRAALVAGGFLLALLAFILLAPVISGHSATAVSDDQYHSPTVSHWFGTDMHGRDLLSRVCDGARVSLLVGLAGASVSLVIGVLWGATAGYAGGWWDGAMMRIVDILYSLPSIIFVVVLVTTLEEA
ncbi:MAG TPA: ABC transporter permease, partial [Verrucomicrobiae bacterium]|nr:ABC transporter permease [Verrucomicrobiae bacterium]